MITTYERCTREIKPSSAMAEAAFDKKENIFTSILNLNLKKELVPCCIWGITLYGVDT
jgi:hypothetical protein